MDSQEQLKQAFELLRAGQKGQAQAILAPLVRQEPGNARAWYGLAACVDSVEKRKFCLEKALQIDPNNASAQREMAKLATAGPPQAQPPVKTIPPAPRPGAAKPYSPGSLSQPAVEAAGPPSSQPGEQPAAESLLGPRPVGMRLEWYQVWISVLLRPNDRTFQMILNDPAAKPGRGYVWVFTTTLLTYLLTAIIMGLSGQNYFSQLAGRLGGQAQSFDMGQLTGYMLIAMIIFAPIAAVFAVLGVMLSAAIFQFIAKFMIGQGTFGEMAYALAAVSAPMALISLLVSAVPVVNLVLGLPLSLYGLYLMLAAIKAVNRFEWGNACATVVVVPILMMVCLCLFTAALSQILPPASGIYPAPGFPYP